ncbi:MAG: hypothetical protein JSU61_02205 [Fidelibacterota bacterium]|nr:MAG: hypothetical protein JSU61_02205 [Candidatus Neomarinimicrobiota bacterium]
MVRILVICLPLLASPWLSTLTGQQEPALARLAQLNGRLAPKALADHITIQAGEITLEEALKLIARHGQVGLSYNHDHLPLNQLVSLRLSDVTVLDALVHILDQTNTELVITGQGQLVIVPEKQPVKDAAKSP